VSPPHPRSQRDFSALDSTLDVDSLPPPDIKGTIKDPSCGHLHWGRTEGVLDRIDGSGVAEGGGWWWRSIEGGYR